MFASTISLESLRRLEIFSSSDDRLLKQITKLANEVHAGAAQPLAIEGATSRRFHVIARGTADVTVNGHFLASLGEGDFFGEMSLLDGRPNSASVTATSPVRLYSFEPRAFYSLISDFPAVTHKIMRGLAERIRHAQGAVGSPA